MARTDDDIVNFKQSCLASNRQMQALAVDPSVFDFGQHFHLMLLEHVLHHDQKARQHADRDGVTTFEAIGRTMGVSRERVRQIEGYALRTIRRRVAFAEGRGVGGGEQAELFAVGGA